jgi:hypothetical protein
MLVRENIETDKLNSMYYHLDGESLKKRYNVTLTEINELFPPTDPAAWMDLDVTLLRAFDTSLFSYARWQQVW